MRKHCKKCGYEIFDTNSYHNFCPHCGTALSLDDNAKSYLVTFAPAIGNINAKFILNCTDAEFAVIDEYTDNLREACERVGYTFPTQVFFIEQRRTV